MYTNSQSLLAHKEEFNHQVMKRMNPAILALSESRLIPDIDDSEICIPGYNSVRCDSENRYTGGVILYIRNDIKYEIVFIDKLVSNCWFISVEIKESLYRGMILLIYHSPSASKGDFIRFLENKVEEIIKKHECIVLGDFNIDITSNSFYANKLCNTMSHLGMKQYVNNPTRRTKDSQTVIDLVFANKDLKVCVYDKPKITDHSWIKINLGINKVGTKYKELVKRDYSRFNEDDFIQMLEQRVELNIRTDLNVNVQSDLDININISRNAKIFTENIIYALEALAPKKIYKIPKVWAGKMWYTEDIKIAADRRDKAYCKAKYSRDKVDWENYKIERNTVIKLIKTKKKDYYETMIDNNKKDPKLLWRTLKKLLKGETMTESEVLDIDFETIDDKNVSSVADKFNVYYVQSVDDIIESIDICKDKSMIEVGSICNKDGSTMEYFNVIDIAKLEQIVVNLPDKKGTEEGITSKILKMAFRVVNEDYVKLINSSLSTGHCPDEWKISTILPIPKIIKPKKASEYRPINVLPIYEKVWN